MKRLRLLHEVSGDFPFSSAVALPRVYESPEIDVNPHGAVSVLTDSGEWLGIKPSEMEWL